MDPVPNGARVDRLKLALARDPADRGADREGAHRDVLDAFETGLRIPAGPLKSDEGRCFL